MNGIWQHRRSQGLTGFERSEIMCESVDVSDGARICGKEG
jgi:hypothetical protein